MARNDTAAQELRVCQLGVMPYAEALALQERLREQRQRDLAPDTLLLLEHPPVYTLGRRTQAADLPLGEDFYRARGIELHRSDRGGRITYHGPGQLVGYAILAVCDVLAYVRALERSIVHALGAEGIAARTRNEDGADFTGVWVHERKIASIGVHLQRGVTTHGLAVNVINDLEPFAWVVPCGLAGVQMTSLARELGVPPQGPPAEELMRRLRARIADCLGEELRLAPREVPACELGVRTAPPSRPAPSRAPLHVEVPA